MNILLSWGNAMSEIIVGILSFIGGLLTCKVIAKLNIQNNKLFSFINTGKINQKNESK